jgi:RecJ-like exonuclease
VTKDISFFKLNQQRAGTAAPLILIVDNGSTDQDLLAIQKASLFGADVIVIDHHDPGAKDSQGQTPICRSTLAHVNPHLVGIDKNLSASMLCYQVAAYVDELNEPSVQLAAVGGIADKCEGNPIDHLVKQSKKSKAFFEELAKCIDYEIYHTKFNHSVGSLYELFDGPQQEALMKLYKPLMAQEREQVKHSVLKFQQEETIGAYHVSFLDGEATTLWGDYYSIGKLAAILHQEHTQQSQHITIVYSNNIIVFRVQQSGEHHFDVNELLAQLTEKINYARIDGGGHDVAGSIRFVSAAKEEILDYIKTYIASK